MQSLFSKLVGIFLPKGVAEVVGSFASRAVGAGYGKKQSTKGYSFIDEDVPYGLSGAESVDSFGFPRQDFTRLTEGLAGAGREDIERIYRLYGPMILANARISNTFTPALMKPLPSGGYTSIKPVRRQSA